MGITKSIQSNRIKTILLILSLPALLLFIVRAYFTYQTVKSGYTDTNMQLIMIGILLVITIWFVISFLIQRRLIFKFTGAKPLNRKNNPKIYNIVENLCISKGLPTPQIGIIEDDSMNAFATGRQQKKARIVFSRGLINKLNTRELEAVAGHELTHIINKDVLLIAVIITFVGIIGTLGQLILRGGRLKPSKDNGNGGFTILIIGLGLVILGYIIYPIIRLAISRKREFLADAGSVELTKDKNAMISALQKIEKDSNIESIKKYSIAAMCIETPFANKEKSSRRRKLWMTHPSISERIKELKQY